MFSSLASIAMEPEAMTALSRCRRAEDGAVLILAVVLAISSLGAQAPARSWTPPEYPRTLSDRFPASLPYPGMRVIRLRGSVLVSDPAVVRPSTMVVQGRSLWMNDEVGDPFIHVVNLDTRTVVRSFGRAGEGPGDFRNVMQLASRPGDVMGMWAYDMSQRRLSRLTREPSAGARATIRSEHAGPSLRMLWLTRDRLLIIGSADSARLVFADSAGRIRGTKSGPLPGGANVPLHVRSGASEGIQVCPRPSGDRLGIGYVNAARIEIYDSAGSFLGLVRGLPWGLEQGDFVRTQRGEWGLPRIRYYYRSCSATTRYYYGLFAGRTDAAGPEGTKRWDSQYVHVVDWAGDLRAVLELDQFAEGIAVDGDSVLYAGGGAMDGIYRYRLPAELIPSSRP